MNSAIQSYNNNQQKTDKEICDLLATEIDKHLPKAVSKIWHAHPVWFLDENPIVGYSKLKNCIRLLFWSGQSFDEASLQNEGSFKAAEIRYTSVNEVNTKNLKRWIKKAETIQWDYKNIVKRKGVLEKLILKKPIKKPSPYGSKKFISINEYHAEFSPDIQKKLVQLRKTIKQAAPYATEIISYNIPTFKQNKNLVHYAAYKGHIGFYPTSKPLIFFKDELAGYTTSKGAIQFPIDKPLPIALIKKIVQYRVIADKEQTPVKKK